jgi:DnaJ-class molecular chaperone
MLLAKIEAAMKLGLSIELLDTFSKKCPKLNETRLLKTMKVDGQVFFDEGELLSYQNWLSEPWQYTKGQRPPIPDAVKSDIKAESHYGCAICGYSDNGEVAHIEAVAETLNNSPDNLIFLCPNHHTKYDLGYKPSSNITLEVVRAAKLVKRSTRQRVMRHEANATKLLVAVASLLKGLEQKLKHQEASVDLVQVYLTETKSLMERLPDLAANAGDAAKADKDLGDVGTAIAKVAPKLLKASSGSVKSKEDSAVRTALSAVVKTVDDELLDFDEVECPHCCGAGMTGLVGDLCVYCKGACFVSSEEADAYDPDDIDQVECPRCGGRGMIGLASTLCTFCKGSCVVTSARAEEFDEDNLPEKECPHCNGTGTRGLVSDVCPYCKGDTFVSKEELAAYDQARVDEVECPHCNGAGTTGLVSDLCRYCGGSQFVTLEKKTKYTRDKIDEVECPHCNGTGLRGAGEFCAYCRGSQVISTKKAEEYDPDDFDEETCPRCNGSGQIGLVGDQCRLCKGNGFVTEAKASAYRKKYE